VGRLRQALHGDDAELPPEWAADALSRSREGRSVLREALGVGVAATTRRAAVYGFVWARKIRPEDFNRLLRIFEDRREDPGIRGQAAEALGPRVGRRMQPGKMRRRDALARSAFLRGLEDPEPEVRFWSIFALASPWNGWVIPKLESMTNDDSAIPGMWTVGQEARWAIHWIGGRGDLDPRSL
jgi:HEAT repeat protein